MLNMHIFLVGMAGAGKTSLGRRLAANLNIPFMDTDQRVSEIMGMDGSGQAGSNNDLYFDVSVGGQVYTFTVESYLCGEDTAILFLRPVLFINSSAASSLTL